MFNIKKIREQMLAAGTSNEKIEAYLESLADITCLTVEKTFAVRPTTATPATATTLVVMSDGTLGRPEDGEAVEHWTR